MKFTIEVKKGETFWSEEDNYWKTRTIGETVEGDSFNVDKNGNLMIYDGRSHIPVKMFHSSYWLTITRGQFE